MYDLCADMTSKEEKELQLLVEELEAQMKMLREKLSFYEAKIRRLECEVRIANSSGHGD